MEIHSCVTKHKFFIEETGLFKLQLQLCARIILRNKLKIVSLRVKELNRELEGCKTVSDIAPRDINEHAQTSAMR